MFRRRGCSGRLPRGGVDRNNFVGTVAEAAPVASLAEAWIETILLVPWPRQPRSPPSRRRGSKLQITADIRMAVASPPSRRRGSKLRGCRCGECHGRSPPSRRRGSKPCRPQVRTARLHVASLAEAWIETCPAPVSWSSQSVASLAEAWIETPTSTAMAAAFPRRLPRGGVDRNAVRSGISEITIVASLAEAWIETIRDAALCRSG